MYSTNVPLKYRFCTDCCDTCLTRTAITSFPHSVREIGDTHITLAYVCRQCGDTWTTGYEKNYARNHSSQALFEYLELGLRAGDGQLGAAR